MPYCVQSLKSSVNSISKAYSLHRLTPLYSSFVHSWILQWIYLKAEGTFFASILTKTASTRVVYMLISKCIYNGEANVRVLSSWSLGQCEELDKILATEI